MFSDGTRPGENTYSAEAGFSKGFAKDLLPWLSP